MKVIATVKNSKKTQNQLGKQKQILSISHRIDGHFRQTSLCLLAIAENFYDLRKIMSWQELLELAKTRWSLSRAFVQRLLNIHVAFKNHRNNHILKTKPSVLYLLASVSDAEEVQKLIKGHKLRLGGKLKTLNEFTVKDAKLVAAKARSGLSTERQREEKEASQIHFKLATIIESFDDIAKTIERYLSTGVEIKERTLLKNYVRVAIKNLKVIESNL